MGIEGMTKDRVSAMCRALDQQVELFRGRPSPKEDAQWNKSFHARKGSRGGAPAGVCFGFATGCSACLLEGEELPFLGNAFELVRAAISKHQS